MIDSQQWRIPTDDPLRRSVAPQYTGLQAASPHNGTSRRMRGDFIRERWQVQYHGADTGPFGYAAALPIGTGRQLGFC